MKQWLFIFILVIVSSCGSTPCAPGNLYFGIIGFSDAESQNIILRRFTKGQNFSNKLDTVLVRYGFKRSNDTLEVTSLNGEEVLWSQYDYEVFFPTGNRLYRISDIHEIQSAKKHSIFNPKKDGCINNIPHLNINGQLTMTTNWNTFYLTR